MVDCKKCHTPNSLDSRFCKSCGSPIGPDELKAAQGEAEALAAEGYKIFSEGRTAEAMLVAETVLESDPASTSALSLKGMCHERAGEVSEALACYERVVELNPDSALDKIKVTHLRNTLASKLADAPPPPDRARALLGAFAATVLVVAMGVAIAGYANSGGQRTASNERNQAMEGADAPFVPIQPGVGSGQQNPNGDAGAAGGAPNQAAPQANQQPAAQPQQNPGAARTGADAPRITPNPNVGPLPAPGLEPWLPENIRVDPSNPPAGTQTNPAPNTNTQPSAPPNAGAGDRDVGPDPKTNEPPKENPGIIEIKVSRPSATQGGGVNVPDTTNAETLARAGRQRQLAGRYSEAIKLYEQALRAGADPATTNQRLGQCHAHLGQMGQAAAAYGKAISAYEAAIQSGGGDRARLESGLEACRQALKVAKGGE